MELAPINQPQKRTMSIFEVAQILQREESTIRKIAKDLFPELFQNGIKTRLEEHHVTAVKLNLGKNSELPKTNLEKELLIMQAMQFQQEKIQTLQQQLTAAEEKIFLDAPKVEAHDILMKTDTMMCITVACKHFGVHPRKEAIPYLIEKGYLTLGKLPTQKAIDADVLSLRESASKRTGKAYLQAVVQANQLEKFGKIITKAVNQ